MGMAIDPSFATGAKYAALGPIGAPIYDAASSILFPEAPKPPPGEKPPAPPPDLTDEAVKKARAGAKKGPLGLSATFLTGPLGEDRGLLG